MEALNIQLSPFFQWLLKTSLQGSLLICLILLVKSVLRGRLPIRWHYYLWLLLLVRLALPWAPQSRLSMFNLIPQYSSPKLAETALTTESTGDAEAKTTANYETTRNTAEQTVVEQQTMQPKSATPENKLTSTSAPLVPETDSPDRSDSTRPVSVGVVRILPLAWLLGAVALGGYIAVRNFNLWRTIKRERPVTDSEILELLEDCKMQMNVQTIVGVIVTDRVKSPALFGFVRPRLLLPQGLIEAFDLEELHYVFLHELAHLKRHDIYLGWLVSLLQVMHWFNPLIWFALRRIRTDQELACDGLVLSTMKTDEPPKYGRTIVNLFERFSQVSYVPSLAGILEEPSQLERRIKMIAKFKNNSYQWSPLGAVLIIILACVSLPDAKRTKASEEAALEPAPPVTLRQVWSGPDADAYGGPSPDGRYLSHTEWKNGDLAIRELATGKTRRLTEMKKGGRKKFFRFALNSVISPDGKLIAYSWTNQYGTYDLCVVGTDGSGDRTLYSNKDHELYPGCWSSDGKRIAARKFCGHLEIISVSVADGSVQVLKAFEKSFWPQFCYSPDDRFVVYDFPVAENSGNHDISLARTDRSGEIPLIKHPANDRLLGWVPNSDQILFRSDRSGTHDIWAIKVVDGKVQGAPSVITREVGEISPQGFSRDGNFYFSRYTRRFTTQTAPFDVRTGQIQNELGRTLLGSNFGPEWSPDGEYLAYVEEQTKPAGPGWYHRPLHIRNVKTGEERTLAGKYGVRAPRWSPDGRTILVIGAAREEPRQGNYNGGIYKIDVEGGQVTEVVQFPPVEEWSRDIWIRSISEWSRDGKTIFYTSRNRLIRRELKSGKEKQLYEKDRLARALDLSPDGKRLVFVVEASNEARASILTIPVSGGEATELCRFQESKGGIRVARQLTWTPDGNYVLFVRNEEKGSTVWRVSSGGGDPEVIWTSKDRLAGLSVHPEGDRIAVSSYLQEQSIWVMENFLPGAPVAKPEPAPTLRQVMTESGDFMSLSPDGKYLCDVDWDTGNLVVRELATGNVRSLTDKSSWEETDYATISAISRDSKRVAFLWYNHEGHRFDLREIGLDGSGDRVVRRLLKKDQTIQWFEPAAWSPDGKQILGPFSRISRTGEHNQIVWVSTADGSIRTVKDLDEGWPEQLDVSPDGRYIVYDLPQEKDTSRRDIFAFDIEENREVPLVQHPADDKFMGWTPDGKHIFFTSDRMRSWDGWILRVDRGEPSDLPELVKASIGDVSPIGFTRNGSFYYAPAHGLVGVYTAALDLQTGTVLSSPKPVRHTGTERCADWSPDGKHLAYCTRPRGERSQIIHIRSVETGRERQLDAKLPHFRCLRWSPDDRFILVGGFEEKNLWNVIYKVDVLTGERTVFLRTEAGRIPGAALSPDGKTLLYSHWHGAARSARFMVRDMETGREKQLARAVYGPHPYQAWALSPDGKQLAFILEFPGAPKTLNTISTTGGEQKELLRIREKVGAVAWTLNSQNVLFMRGKTLWRIPAEGGEPRKLWTWNKKHLSFEGIRVHPDGRNLAFTVIEPRNEVWVMENFLPEAVASAEK
jgi:beta-lactamase regulating signal transducer with metallopeptidase domain/Tol biopolymer transport system component